MRRPAEGSTHNDQVRIHYCRPPGRITVFEQTCVYEDDTVIVTLAERTGIPQPMRIGETTALEPESAVVWFTFPNWLHDIGRFHLRDGSFTGLYANLITPVAFEGPRSWRTTDLFLDLWLANGSDHLELVDADELDDALRRGWISADQAELAHAEAGRIIAEFEAGRWPPPVVEEWTLSRAQDQLRRHLI